MCDDDVKTNTLLDANVFVPLYRSIEGSNDTKYTHHLSIT
jgi:hypothetical protein